MAHKHANQTGVLSAGEQQRACIARAIINNPIILLADEPTGNVDDQIAARIMHLFEELNKTGTTVVIATHNKAMTKGSGCPVMKLEGGLLNITGPKKNKVVSVRHELSDDKKATIEF